MREKYKRFRPKSLYDRFMEDYTAVVTPCENKRGFKIEYVYYAPWHMWKLPEDQLRIRKRIIMLECVASIMVFVASASMPTGLNALRLVAFPALVSLLALCIEIFGVGQFFFARYRTTRSNYRSADRRIRVYPLINILASLTSAMGCLYYMIRYAFSLTGAALTLCYCAQAALSYLIRRQYVRLPFGTELNDILNHVQRVEED